MEMFVCIDNDVTDAQEQVMINHGWWGDTVRDAHVLAPSLLNRRSSFGEAVEVGNVEVNSAVAAHSPRSRASPATVDADAGAKCKSGTRAGSGSGSAQAVVAVSTAAVVANPLEMAVPGMNDDSSGEEDEL